jgi:hypothetical protein
VAAAASWAAAITPPESEGGIVPAVTPVSSFYQVTKNFRDPIIDGAAWCLQIEGLVNERPRAERSTAYR